MVTIETDLIKKFMKMNFYRKKTDIYEIKNLPYSNQMMIMFVCFILINFFFINIPMCNGLRCSTQSINHKPSSSQLESGKKSIHTHITKDQQAIFRQLKIRV